MSDSCQLDQLTLRRLDSSLAATQATLPVHTVGAPGGDRGCGGWLPCPLQQRRRLLGKADLYKTSWGLILIIAKWFLTRADRPPHRITAMGHFSSFPTLINYSTGPNFPQVGLDPCIAHTPMLSPPNRTSVSSNVTQNRTGQRCHGKVWIKLMTPSSTPPPTLHRLFLNRKPSGEARCTEDAAAQLYKILHISERCGCTLQWYTQQRSGTAYGPAC